LDDNEILEITSLSLNELELEVVFLNEDEMYKLYLLLYFLFFSHYKLY